MKRIGNEASRSWCVDDNDAVASVDCECDDMEISVLQRRGVVFVVGDAGFLPLLLLLELWLLVLV